MKLERNPNMWTSGEIPACPYEAMMSVEGVTEVEILSGNEEIAYYVQGGDDQAIAAIMTNFIYVWNEHWLVGDTEVKREFCTVRFYRSKEAFRAKFKELFGQEFDQCSLS